MNRISTKLGAGVGAVIILLGVMTLMAPAVMSWVHPLAKGEAPVCIDEVRTVPASVTMTNLEVGNYGSPGHPSVQSVYPNFTYSNFTPEVLPNTGDQTATMTVDVPADFEGDVVVNWKISWYGTDGTDSAMGTTKIHVVKCLQPTTTTSTTEPETTTTTSTTEPETTTTSTTEPETTTTSTTEPSTTTTYLTPCKEPLEGGPNICVESTTTTVPETTSTYLTPCEEPLEGGPTICVESTTMVIDTTTCVDCVAIGTAASIDRELPVTGSDGTLLYTTIGCLLIVVGCFMLLQVRKANKYKQ